MTEPTATAPRSTAKPRAKPAQARSSAKAAAKPAAKPATTRRPARRAAAKAPERPNRLGWFGGIAVGVAAGAALVAYLLTLGGSSAGHAAPDLALDQPHPGPDHRAPEAFRPDATAPVPANERDALRPAFLASA